MNCPMMSPRGFVVALAIGFAGVACNNESSSSGASAQPSASAATPPPAVSASAAASAAPGPSASAASASDAGAGNGEAEKADEEKNVEELHAHHRHEQGGFAGFVMSAIDTLGVTPEQQPAIDTFKKEYQKSTKPLREANHAIRAIVADGLAAGKIDHAKVEAEVNKAAAAAPAVHVAVQNLLAELHKTLRPEQRATLVDKVDAHFSVWKDVTTHPAEGAKGDKHLKHLTKDLSLSKDQVDKIQVALDAAKEKKPFDAAQADIYLKAFDKEFADEKFDAKKLPAAGPESGKLVAWGAGRMASFYETIAPILTAEQRTTLAEKLRQHGEKPETKEKP